MKTDWKWILIVLLIVALIAAIQKGCRKQRDVLVETIVVTDTVRGTDTVFFPAPYRTIEVLTDTIAIDTAQIIRDYFSEKSYALNFGDTAMNAVADITVKENAVQSAALDYEFTRTQTLTTIEKIRDQKFFFALGGGLSYSVPYRKPGIELQAAVGIRRHTIYAGFDFLNLTPRIGWQYSIIVKH